MIIKYANIVRIKVHHFDIALHPFLDCPYLTINANLLRNLGKSAW